MREEEINECVKTILRLMKSHSVGAVNIGSAEIALKAHEPYAQVTISQVALMECTLPRVFVAGASMTDSSVKNLTGNPH